MAISTKIPTFSWFFGSVAPKFWPGAVLVTFDPGGFLPSGKTCIKPVNVIAHVQRQDVNLHATNV